MINSEDITVAVQGAIDNETRFGCLKKKFKIVFVAHEFGLYKGHGGIASYLYNICSYLSGFDNFSVEVITLPHYDLNCNLLLDSKIKLHVVPHANLEDSRKEIYKIISDISPNYVEFTDYLALGLDCVKNKRYKNALSETVLVTNNHSATKECLEWSNITLSSDDELVSLQEQEQMKFSDYCIAPSKFLADYIKKHYQLDNDVLVFANPYNNTLREVKEIKRELKDHFYIEKYENSFNIVLITRFEPRKCQEKLIRSVLNLRKEGLNINLFLAGNTIKLPNGETYLYSIYKSFENFEGIYIYDFLTLPEQEKLIAIADLTVLPSTYENQPVAMVEMCLRGIPVMASEYSGIADYTENSELLFDPFIEEDLDKKIREFHSLPKDIKKAITIKQQEALKYFIEPKNSIIARLSTLSI